MGTAESKLGSPKTARKSQSKALAPQLRCNESDHRLANRDLLSGNKVNKIVFLFW